MSGVDDKEIQSTRDKAMKWIADNGYEFQDSFVTEQVPDEVVNSSVWYLAKSLEFMSNVTAVYFCKGWETARGCVIEHTVASEYGIECIYEEEHTDESDKVEQPLDIAGDYSIYEQMNDIDDEVSLVESKTGYSYKGYIICCGLHETDRWYVKDGWDRFVGDKSGYTNEEEALAYVDSITD